MRRMNIAICDDDVYVTEKISKYLKQYYHNNCLIHIFESGEKLLAVDSKYDIAFLDIELGGMDGIQLAAHIRKKDKQVFIVFVTNYSDYCQRAFNVHAFEYLTKPVYKEDLLRVLQEVELYKKEDIQDNLIWLKSQGGGVQLKINDIIYFEYYSRRVRVVYDRGEHILSCTLKEIGNLFYQYDFSMPHRAYIVNLRKIETINKFDILMSNNDIVPLAQKKAAEFKKQFEVYLYTYKKR